MTYNKLYASFCILLEHLVFIIFMQEIVLTNKKNYYMYDWPVWVNEREMKYLFTLFTFDGVRLHNG
jgi:hypothetical protein